MVVTELRRTGEWNQGPWTTEHPALRQRPEFIADKLAGWLGALGIDQAFIEKGTPQQNPFVERFNGTMRDEVLDGEYFNNILEARAVLLEWVEHYNTRRPHRGLGMKTPEEFYRGIRVVGK